MRVYMRSILIIPLPPPRATFANEREREKKFLMREAEQQCLISLLMTLMGESKAVP
jgi:hypothetical protein